MTPLLQQAREALAPFAAQFVSETGACHSELTDAKNCGRCSKILTARAALTALDTYEALSEYDKDKMALNWIRGYNGSIDSLALTLAFKAGMEAVLSGRVVPQGEV